MIPFKKHSLKYYPSIFAPFTGNYITLFDDIFRGRGGGAANLGASSDLIGEMARNATQDHKQSYEVEYDVFHIDFSIHSLESKPGDPWIVVDDIRCIT